MLELRKSALSLPITTLHSVSFVLQEAVERKRAQCNERESKQTEQEKKKVSMKEIGFKTPAEKVRTHFLVHSRAVLSYR